MKRKGYLRRALAVATLLAMMLPAVAAPAAAETTSDGESYLSDRDVSDNGAADIPAFGATPTEEQYGYHRQELAAFLHFNMNTFTGSEWGDGTETTAMFTLDKKVDAENYVKTLKEAGFGSLMVVAKHHDGFCIWDSAWTQHDTAGTAYPGGDVLADLSAACTKYDMKMGLYLSPWDENSAYYGYYDANGNPTDAAGDVLDYNEYYTGQLEEILGNDKYGNNGKFYEIWMDGAKGSGADAQEYDFDRYFSTIKRYEGENILLFGAGAHSNVYWIGNEAGVANEETWSQGSAGYDANGHVTSMNFWGIVTTYKGNTVYGGCKNGNVWAIPEVDARITSGWFWGVNKRTPKTIQELRDMYVDSVGHNSVLLLNIPLNDQGELDAAIEDRVRQFGRNIRESFFENNLAAAEGATILADSVHQNDLRFKPSNVVDGKDNTYWTAQQGSKNSTLIVDLGREVLFDGITIEEEINLGQRVESFTVSYRNGDGEWREYVSGATIGAKRVVIGKAVQATQVRIDFTGVTNSAGEVATPAISHVGIYKVSSEFAMEDIPPEGIDKIHSSDPRFDTTGWDYVTDDVAVTENYHRGRSGDVMTVTFTGTKAWLKGIPAQTSYLISVDGQEAVSVTPTDELLYETEDLAYGEHTLRIEVTSRLARISALYALDNEGKGYLDFAQSDYAVDENTWLDVTILRKGGSSGRLSAIVQDNPGSAVQSSYVPTEGIPVVFEDGETEKTVRIRIKRYTEKTGTLAFTLDLAAGDGETELVKGFNTPARVEIYDADSVSSPFLQSIEITRGPDKTDYTVGDAPDPTGMIVTGTFRSGAVERRVLTDGKRIGASKTIQLDQPVTTDGLRLVLEEIMSGKTDIPGICEIEVYNGDEEVNLALNARAIAVSEYYAAAASCVNDGDPANHWIGDYAGAEALPVWVELRWDEEVTFDRVVVREWDSDDGYRINRWTLESSHSCTFSRELEADEYQITPAQATAAGEQTFVVTATENPLATATFTALVMEAQTAEAEALMLALPDADQVTPDDEAAVKAAREAYDGLTDEQKNMISAEALKKLTDAEARLNTLQEETPDTEPRETETEASEGTTESGTQSTDGDGGNSVRWLIILAGVAVGGGIAVAVVLIVRRKK